MTGFLEIEITGETESVDRMLRYLDAVLSPAGTQAFLRMNVGPYLESRVRDRFADEGDDVVGKWAPLAPATQDIRSRQGFSSTGPINRRTSELEDYLTQNSFMVTPNALGATLTLPGKESGKRSIMEKMQTAQRGRAFPRTPPRPVLGMNERDLAYVLTTLAFFIQQGGGEIVR